MSAISSQAKSLKSQASSELVLSAHEWGMLAFLLSETAFFCTLIVVYLAFIGASARMPDRIQFGPTPAILSLPLVIGMTACLLSSSVTIHLAAKKLRLGDRSAFVRWWSATILLGIAFLVGTGCEWTNLIGQHGLTISRNVFGTTYYTLIGFHGLHVTVGVIVMIILLAFAKLPSPFGRAGGEGLGGAQTAHHPNALPKREGTGQVGVELVSWYWHFVDVVWLVVFTVVYVVGR